MGTVRRLLPADCALVWRLHPNGGRIASVAVPRTAAERLMRHGSLTINGCRASVHSATPESCGRVALRITFDEPYPFPHV